jgi:hypothetical protein
VVVAVTRIRGFKDIVVSNELNSVKLFLII